MLALGLTWPLALHLTSYVSLGSESVPTVPYFNLWTLGWNVSRLAEWGSGYWDAPIFHPIPGAFAFSDPQPLTGLLAAPLWSISPTLAYNWVMLLFTALNGFAVYQVLRKRHVAVWPALLAGVLAQSMPFLAYERGVLQLQPFFGVVWAIDQLWSLAEQHRWKNGLGFGLAAAVTFLTSEYYAAFLLLLLLPAFVLLASQLKRRQTWTRLLAGICLASALVLPVALSQHSILKQMGFQRSEKTIRKNSATLSDYGRLPKQVVAGAWYPGSDEKGRRLCPGLGLALLGFAGAIVGVLQPVKRRWTVYLLSAGTVAFLGSFGLNLSVGGWQPYSILQAWVPGFEQLRSPYRLSLFVQLAFVLLAGQLLQTLWQRGRFAVAVILVAVTFLEVAPRPGRLVAVPPTLPASALKSPTVLLPFPAGRKASDYADTTVLMYGALPSATSLVNGYSGYFPQWNAQLKTLLADFPTPVGIAALRALGVQTILIQSRPLSPEQTRRLSIAVQNKTLTYLGTREGVHAFLLRGAEFRPAQQYQGPWLLRSRIKDGTVEITARAAIPDDQVYVVAPGIAALRWHVRLTDPHGTRSEQTVHPTGSLLLCRDSDLCLHVDLNLPRVPGRYHLQMVDSDTGQTLGDTSFRIR